jgi:hypothetical protein
MAGSEKRKRERKRRERRAVGKGELGSEVQVLTAGPVEQVFAGNETSLRLDPEHPDYEAFRAAMVASVEVAPQTVIELREQIARICGPYHAFDVVFALWNTYNIVFTDTMRPLGDGPTRIPEYVAHVLLERDSAEPVRPLGDEERISGPDPAELASLAERIFTLLPLWFDHRQSPDPRGENPWLDLRSRFYMQRLLVSSFTYEWQERATLRELFDPVAADLRVKAGFTAEEALVLLDALGEVLQRRAGDRVRIATESMREMIAQAAALRQGEIEGGAPYVDRLAALPEDEAEEAAATLTMSWAFHAIGRDASFTASDLAEAAAVGVAAAESFLSAFSAEFGESDDRAFWKADPAGAVGGELDAMRNHPLLHDGGGRYLPTAIDTVFYGIRDVLTESLKRDQRTWKRFERARGRMLERRAVDALADALGADWSHTGVKFRYLDAEGEVAEGEADGILRAGSVVVLVETKAGTLAASARRAAPARLERGLKDLIGDAHEQLSRSHIALVEGQATEICDADGKPLVLDVEKVSRTLRVAVSLEQLSPLAPAVWQLQEAGLLPEEDQLPLTIGIHELELICDLVESPAQLIHYIVRRLRTMRQRIWAMDEMDFFMKYLDDGLYYEDGRLQDVHAEVHSYTKPLDAYLYGEQGLRPKAKRPRQKLDAKTRDLLRQLGAVSSPARLEAQLMILELDEKSRRQVCSRMRQVSGMTERDGEPHDVTLVFDGDMGITIHCVPDDQIGQLAQTLRNHGYGRSEKSGLSRWLGIGTVPRPRGKVVAMALLVDSSRAEVY